VTSIGDYAFNICSSLTSVTFKSEKVIPRDTLTSSKINNTTPIYYVPANYVETYRGAWAGVVAAGQIQPDPTGERLITVEGLKTYHNTLKERYLNSMATQDWVNERLVGKTDYLGTTDSMPNFTAAGAGDYCRVSAEFIYDEATNEIAHIGDILIAVKDRPTQDKADWDLVHNEMDKDTWTANTAAAAGYVEKGEGQINKVWGTDSDGNPGWIEVMTLDTNQTISAKKLWDNPRSHMGVGVSAGGISIGSLYNGEFINYTQYLGDNLIITHGTDNYQLQFPYENDILATQGYIRGCMNTIEANIQSYVQQYIHNNFATLMKEYLNSEAATENKPTEADISEVFNENEEA
jgi:hypothetical protein